MAEASATSLDYADSLTESTAQVRSSMELRAAGSRQAGRLRAAWHAPAAPPVTLTRASRGARLLTAASHGLHVGGPPRN
jgi:hypothetical protein